MKFIGLGIAAFAGFAAIAGVAASPAQALERRARCVVETSQTIAYRGPCLFEAERSGSFTIDPPAGRRFGGDIASISLAVTGRGTGEVRGMTRGGINSRWGSAVRSARDRACWVGDDFRICAY